MQRRLAAIMVADIVAYSSLMEEAEEHTANRVARCRELIREQVASLGGRIFNTAGDAWLAEFGSAIEVDCRMLWLIQRSSKTVAYEGL